MITKEILLPSRQGNTSHSKIRYLVLHQTLVRKQKAVSKQENDGKNIIYVKKLLGYERIIVFNIERLNNKSNGELIQINVISL